MTEDREQRNDRPIAFRLADPAGQRIRLDDDTVRLRTLTRSLDGMQKEALVEHGPTGTVWRLLSDEGPWLNGTDLAPFPLGYFAAGLAASLMSDILAEAAESDVQVESLDLRVDNFFTMEGSILKGTMAAKADAVQLNVNAGPDADELEIVSTVALALERRSAAYHMLVDKLPGLFSVRLNGRTTLQRTDRAGNLEQATDPAAFFDGLQSEGRCEQEKPIIRKDNGPPTSADEGAIGLRPNQKRIVRVHADAALRADGQKQIAVQCIQPSGSRFVLLSDDPPDAGGQGRAPCGLTYLSAGIAFCFMTQLGRYAQIKKMRLQTYRIAQDTAFRRKCKGGPGASPVETVVWLDGDDSEEENLHAVKMGEQTCYLHAAVREPLDVSITVSGG